MNSNNPWYMNEGIPYVLPVVIFYVIAACVIACVSAYNAIKNYMYPEIAKQKIEEEQRKKKLEEEKRAIEKANRDAHIEKVKELVENLDPNVKAIVEELVNNPDIMNSVVGTKYKCNPQCKCNY